MDEVITFGRNWIVHTLAWIKELTRSSINSVGKSQQSLFAKLGKKNFEQSALASGETASPNQKEETAS